MNEDFVKYEQAKALKELGFNRECHYRFNIDKQIVPNVVYSNAGVDSDDVAVDVNFRCIGDISAPTLSQAAKWLREVKKLCICSINKIDNRGRYKYQWLVVFLNEDKSESSDPKFFDTYEQALSSGIDKALEFLKPL